MSNEEVSSAQDPLSQAAAGYDTSFPVLMPERLLRFEITSAKKSTNEDSKAESIAFKVKLSKDATFRDGRVARAGFSFNQYVGISPSEKYTWEDIKRNLAVWIHAAFGTKTELTFRDVVDNPSLFEGKVIDARTGVKKDKNGVYPDNTQITPVPPA